MKARKFGFEVHQERIYTVHNFIEIKLKKKKKKSGPSCSKLTMSLVNDSLKF